MYLPVPEPVELNVHFVASAFTTKNRAVEFAYDSFVREAHGLELITSKKLADG